jgi:hypothetical protein
VFLRVAKAEAAAKAQEDEAEPMADAGVTPGA